MSAQIPQTERERVVKELGDYFAQDHLTLDEYERRVESAYRAPNREALVSLTRDLPSLVPATVQTPTTQIERPPLRTRMLALWSAVVRRGAWTVPQNLRVRAVMGAVELDLREAILTGPVTEIDVLAVMGAIEIIVPPDVRLQGDGSAFLGAFEDHMEKAAAVDPAAPIVRVRGLAVLGAVEAVVKARGEE